MKTFFLHRQLLTSTTKIRSHRSIVQSVPNGQRTFQHGHQQRLTMTINAHVSRRPTNHSQAVDEGCLYLSSYELLFQVWLHIFHIHTDHEPSPFYHGVSPAQQWFLENPLAEGDEENDSSSKACRSTFKASSITCRKENNGFRLYGTTDWPWPCAQNIACQLAIRTAHLSHRFYSQHCVSIVAGYFLC